MGFPISIDQESYEALIALAQRGTFNPDGSINQEQAMTLDAFLRSIEKANGITRFGLWVRWQDPKAPLPPGTLFPRIWPPTLQFFLQLVSRPISKADVLELVGKKTPDAVNIMVTPDPAALLGWSKMSDYFVQP